MPDLSLARSWNQHFWIELKAGGKQPELRPEQYAWAMRRSALGGVVLCLHRTGTTWNLHWLARAAFEPKGKGIRIISPPRYSGQSVELLDQALEELWTHHRTNPTN